MRYSHDTVVGWHEVTFVFLAICFFPGLVASAAAPLKMMSFNIRFDAGVPSSNANAWISTTGIHRRDLALSLISSTDPDILGVQEALNNQVVDIQNDLNDYGFYGVGRSDGIAASEYSGIYYRNSRFSKRSQGTFWLNEDSETPGSMFPGTNHARIASWIVLQDHLNDDEEYLVLNTHWDHQIQAARDFSAQLIRDRIELIAGSRPVVVMGDLNATPSNTALLDLMGASNRREFQLIDSYRNVFPTPDAAERTSHGFTGNTIGSQIDYILYSNHFDAEQAEIDRTDFNGNYPSDHYPITTVLTPHLHGDYNRNGFVDAADYTVWRDALSSSVMPGTGADGNGDGFIDGSDYTVWSNNFGLSRQTSTATTVPEPATWCLILVSSFVARAASNHRIPR